MAVEKRKYNRFMVRPDTYAALGPHYTKVGKVRQISIAGLAFEYLCITEIPDRQSTRVTVFSLENEFFLPNLSCRVISDFTTCASDKNPMSDPNYAINQCAVELMAITEGQWRRLDYFLEHHTRGLAPTATEMHPAQEFSGIHAELSM
jgi:hypothetical protein